MAFNIHQQVFNKSGVPIEKKASQYRDQLVQLFEQSPEMQEISDEGIETGLVVDPFLDFGINYLGVTPPQMSPDEVLEILLDLFPRKLSTPAEYAPDMVRELQAFWQFLQKTFQLENAAACLNVLNEKTARKLKREMSDPANFGIAKSFVMMGLERGFDMTSQEGINKWMETYNAEITAGTGPRIPLPGERSASARQFHSMLKSRLAGGSRKKKHKTT